jgi:hypothetical protein
MDRFLATIDTIINRYEKNKIRLPKPVIKSALSSFRRNGDASLILSYYQEHRESLLADMTKFLTEDKSAIIKDRESYVAVSAFYLLAKELADDISKNYDLSRIDRLTQYRDYPDLKLPIGYQINLWRAILSVLPEESKDRAVVTAKITELESTFSQSTPSVIPQSGPSTEQLGQLVAGVSQAFQKPKFQDMIQGILGDVQTSDISQLFPKIFGVLQNPEFREVLEEVAKPMTEKK